MSSIYGSLDGDQMNRLRVASLKMMSKLNADSDLEGAPAMEPSNNQPEPMPHQPAYAGDRVLDGSATAMQPLAPGESMTDPLGPARQPDPPGAGSAGPEINPQLGYSGPIANFRIKAANAYRRLRPGGYVPMTARPVPPTPLPPGSVAK